MTKLLLEGLQQSCVEVSRLGQRYSHDFVHHTSAVGLKVEIVQRTSVLSNHSVTRVGLDGRWTGTAQAFDGGHVVGDLRQESLEGGMTSDEHLARSSRSFRNIKSHGDVDAAVWNKMSPVGPKHTQSYFLKRAVFDITHLDDRG